MRLVRHGNGKYSCLACNKALVPVRGLGNRGKRVCPGCGYTIRLPDRRGLKEARGTKGRGSRRGPHYEERDR